MLDVTGLKASTVLQAVVSGLKKSKDDPNFAVATGTFGYVNEGLCCGCAATVALAEMFGGGRSASEMMFAYVKAKDDQSEYAYAHLSNILKFEASIVQGSLPTNTDLRDLEFEIESARGGEVSELIKLLTGEVNKSFDGRWLLTDRDWEEKLWIVEETIAEMIAAGY